MVIYCSIFYLYIIQKTVDINVFTAYYRGSFWIKKLSNTLREPKTKKNSKNSTSKTTTTRRWLFYFVKVIFSNENTQLPDGSWVFSLVELPGTFTYAPLTGKSPVATAKHW